MSCNRILEKYKISTWREKRCSRRALKEILFHDACNRPVILSTGKNEDIVDADNYDDGE
jgi:hypothetical protein